VNAGVGISREARAVLARAADHGQRTFFQEAVKREDVIAGNAEHVANAVVLQAADQVLADRQPSLRHRIRVGEHGHVGQRFQA
jgi:hypothetical protein